jgi:hypothetical protein
MSDLNKNVVFIGLAVADSMFPATATVVRRPLDVAEVRQIVAAGVTSCCTPSHATPLVALAQTHDIVVPVPDKAPFAKLAVGDRLVVLSARFPRRLAEGEVWSKEEVDAATFVFGMWEVQA